MPKTKAQKAVIVAGIADKFRKMKSVAFSSVAGYTMAHADSLRAKAAAENVDVFISKKTLLELAAKEAGMVIDRDALQGSILTAVAYGDEVAGAKLLKELQKTNDQIKLVSGVLEGKVISGAQVLALAALPSKHQLLGQLVGTLQAPISGFVRVMAGNLQGLVGVLGAIKEKKQA